jgi:peptidoglycan/xylan/chitin deacetylase (PgdA/CDA1 family)
MSKFLNTTAAFAFAIAAMTGSIAKAADCPNNPTALGTSRTISVKPTDFPLVGRLNYPETLRLGDHEVVLTFADGPSAPYTGTILDILASECIKATFFMGGNAVVDASDLLRRAVNEGHTVGTGAFSGENLSDLPLDKAKAELDKGIAAANEAAVNQNDVAPFFRAPDFEISKQAERYALSKGLMVWSADVEADDENDPTEDQLVSKLLSDLEESGKGIIALHDSEPVTARALRQLVAELKSRKYKIVQVTAQKRPITTGSAKSVTVE